MERPTHRHDRPLDKDFYHDIRLAVGENSLNGTSVDLEPDDGTIVKVPAGSLIAFEQLAGPQIVNLFMWGSDDPDERYWAEETMLIEGSNIQRYTRLWGTMARFRPLVTVIEDTVITLRKAGSVQAFHHFVHGGSGTPADWAARGGRSGVKSSWQRLTEAMAAVGLEAELLTENASLFQKTAIEPIGQSITIEPSDAMAGDRLILFAEIDLTLAAALSPYGGGGVPIDQLDGSTQPVRVSVEQGVAEPKGWPYDDVPYPDLSLYHDDSDRRDPAIGTTPGDPIERSMTMMRSATSPFPLDADFYAALIAKRRSFTPAWSHVMPARSGYGWRVQAGQVFRLVMVEGGQVADLCIWAADDPREHYAAGAQFFIEGARITRGTRIWGTPPRSRPLAMVTGDTIRTHPPADGSGLIEPSRQHHKCYGAHCNAHHWLLFAGTHPPTCYDNLRDACAQLGMSQYAIHDNMNLFGSFAMDPESGAHNPEPTHAEKGDYLEFYAETDLLVGLSACPYGYSAVPPDQWGKVEIPARPLGVEVLDTNVSPLPWP